MANVNVPTDNKVKEQDINRKLQLYGIYSAFANGKVPSNKQIDVAFNSILRSKALTSPSNKLSKEGQELVGDLRDVIKQLKYLVLSKNEGDVIQEFIWDCQDITGGNASLPDAPTSKETAQQHGDEALNGLKVLGRLVLSNGQFRKLLNDATILLRDMAGDAAQSAADKVNPNESDLKQIDEPAQEDTWHDVPSRDELRSQVQGSIDKNKPFSREEAKAEVKDAARQGQETAQQHPSSSNRDAGSAGAQEAASTLKDRAQQKIDQNVPEETKENARKAKESAVQNTKNYISKKMPEERRDQTIWRLKKMLVEIQGHSDYTEAIDTLIGLAETYGGHARNLADQSSGTIKDARGDSSLRSAEQNLKTILERFANSTSADDLIDAINNVYRDADQDPELKNWFKRLDRFLRKSLQEQGYVLKDSSTQEWDEIYDKGQFLLRDRYRDHVDAVLDEFKFLGEQFDKDPQNKALAQAVTKLFQNLGNDSEGNTQFKPWLITDLTDVIIPAIFENTRYVPVPRIEVSDPTIDVIIENLVLESDNLFPNQLEFGNDNYFRMGRKQASSKMQNKIMIAASGIQMDLRDVAYYINKKQGFPGIRDKGVMDIILQGEGFSFKLAARTADSKDRTHFIAVDTVDVTVHDLKINIKQSNHKLLFKIAKGMLLKVMKPVIQKLIEKQIRDYMEKGDAYLYGVHQEAQKAIKAAAEDPENAPNIYQQYVSAFQEKLTEKKKKAEQVASQTTVNVAVTKEDSIFKNISLPGGISTKATEYAKLAEKGDRWESPIFSWGDARESTDIPKLRPVERKPHSTTTGRLRDASESKYGGPGSAGSTGGYGSSGAGIAGAGAGAGLAGAGAAGAYGGSQRGSERQHAGEQYNPGLATRAAPALGGAGGTGGSGGGTAQSVLDAAAATHGANTDMSSGHHGLASGGGSTGQTGGSGNLTGPAAGLEREMDQAFDPHHFSSGTSGATGHGAPTGASGAGAGGSNVYYDNVTR